MLAAEIASDGETSTSGVEEELPEVLAKAAETLCWLCSLKISAFCAFRDLFMIWYAFISSGDVDSGPMFVVQSCSLTF